jgi:DNA-directed RNA polymerase specialized sigma24 family protein
MSADRPADPSTSWLAQLRDGRPTGWSRLHQVFGPVVRHWCQRPFGLQPADADDVTQQVFVGVQRGIAGFTSGNFVGRLYTITRSAVCDRARYSRH